MSRRTLADKLRARKQQPVEGINLNEKWFYVCGTKNAISLIAKTSEVSNLYQRFDPQPEYYELEENVYLITGCENEDGNFALIGECKMHDSFIICGMLGTPSLHNSVPLPYNTAIKLAKAVSFKVDFLPRELQIFW